MSYEEAAEKLDISMQSLKNRLFKAKTKLKKLIKSQMKEDEK